jgi:hypothetical protein
VLERVSAHAGAWKRDVMQVGRSAAWWEAGSDAGWR